MGTYTIRALFYDEIKENELPRNIIEKGDLQLKDYDSDYLTLKFTLPHSKLSSISYDINKLYA